MQENKISRVVHLADIHLRTYKLHAEYKEVLTDLLDELTEHLSPYKREETRIVLVGDLVHGKTNVSNELLVLGTWLLKSLEEIAPLIVIPGNHDFTENNKEKMDSITPMVTFLENKEISYHKKTGCYLDGNIVWCVYSLYDENTRPEIEAARTEFGSNKTYIGLFHGPIIGSTTDIGYTIEHGTSLEIFSGLDFVLCGDIHKRFCYNYEDTKQIENDRLEYHLNAGWKIKEDLKAGKIMTRLVPCVFCGSTLQQNYGEKLHNHGYLIWDVNNKTYTEHNLANPYEYYNFKIGSLDDLEHGTEKLTNK